MFLDLWSVFVLLSELIELIANCIERGALSISIPCLAFILGFSILSAFAWRSTYIPQLPEVPRPPYVIQISSGPLNYTGDRTSLANVRLLSSGNGGEVDRALRGFHTPRLRVSETRGINRQSTSSSTTSSSAEATVTTTSSVARTEQSQTQSQNASTTALLQGIIRPSLQPIIQRAAASGNPVQNVIVYHRVNIYHHHHHHPVTSQSVSVSGQVQGSSESSGDNQNQSQSHSNPSAVETSSSNTVTGNTSATVEVASGSIENVGASCSVNGDIDGLGKSTVTSTPAPILAQPQPQTDLKMDINSSSPDPNPSASETDIRFTIKFLNDTQMEVTTPGGQKLADFKQRHFATEISENKTVRLIFNGRVLDNDSRTIRESGIYDQCVVHCLIVSRPSATNVDRDNGNQAPQSGAGGGGGLIRGGTMEPGMFFVGFIGVFLVILWFVCFHFGQHLFSQGGVVSLTILTAIFVVGLLASYLPAHPTNQA